MRRAAETPAAPDGHLQRRRRRRLAPFRYSAIARSAESVLRRKTEGIEEKYRRGRSGKRFEQRTYRRPCENSEPFLRYWSRNTCLTRNEKSILW